MKIILLKDVKNIGRKNQVVDISDGYAQNFVIPRKLGVLATKQNLSRLESRKEKTIDDLKDQVKKLVEVKKILEATEIEVVAQLDKTGGVAGSISTKRISDEILKQTNQKIDKKIIEKKEISAVGVTIVKVELFKGITANVKIKVRGK